MSLLGQLVNHHDILPHVVPGVAGVVGKWPPHVLVGDRHGAILLLENVGTVEWHWLLTRAVRGRDALVLARFAVGVAFTSLNAHAIIGSTPRVNRAARFMNRALGAKVIGKSIDSQGRECVDYRLERASWAISQKSAGQY